MRYYSVNKYSYHILAALFVINLIKFWPGIGEMHDSTVQLQQAISGQYSDHHPPLMAFVWRYLNLMYPGPALMYLLQLSMLYAALAILMYTKDQTAIKDKPFANWLLLIFPVYPQILLYEFLIIKDVQFAYSFLLVSAILGYYTIMQKRPSIQVLLLLMPLLIYGTAVKYQAQYCAVIPALWLGSLLNLKRSNWYKLTTGLIIYVLLYGIVYSINNHLIKNVNKNYSWQYVKLYDLAAMSLQLQTDLIPDFNKNPDYSWEKLQQNFAYPAIDSLTFKQQPILKITENPQQMQILKQQWLVAIKDHPAVYLKHRWINMRYILLARPGYEHEAQDVPFIFKNNFQSNSHAYMLAQYIVGGLFYIFMSYLPIIILGIGYFILALFTVKQSKSAQVLLALSSTSLLMVCLLFFMSMAGTPRYAYISIIMIHASHVFASNAVRNVFCASRSQSKMAVVEQLG